MVYGHRSKREKSMGKFWELVQHNFHVFFSRISYVKMPVDVGEFSLMDRKVVDIINSLPEKDRFVRGLRALRVFRH